MIIIVIVDGLSTAGQMQKSLSSIATAEKLVWWTQFLTISGTNWGLPNGGSQMGLFQGTGTERSGSRLMRPAAWQLRLVGKYPPDNLSSEANTIMFIIIYLLL